MLAADRGDEDVGLAGDRGEVAGFRVGDCDGAVFVQEQNRDGFADDVAAADDYGVFAGEVDAGGFDELDAACGSASGKAVLPAEEQGSGVQGVEAVYVLCGVDVGEDFTLVQVFGQGKLHEDAVDVWVGVQGSDKVDKLLFGCVALQVVCGGFNADLLACGDFVFDVDFACGVLANEDDREADVFALGFCF